MILKLTYQELIDAGYFANNESHVAVDPIISAAAQKAFTEYEAENPIGYPLMWETVRETLTELIREVVGRDLEELASSGYVPVDLEIGIDDRLPPDWPDPLNTLAIHGRMDRIDIDPRGNRMRVVDYKFKFGAKPSPEDNDLSRSALRAQRLQPPFYSLLGQAKRRRDSLHDGESQIEASFYYIASRWSEGPLVIKSFNSEELTGKMGAEIKKQHSSTSQGHSVRPILHATGRALSTLRGGGDLPQKSPAESLAHGKRSDHRSASAVAPERSQKMLTAKAMRYRSRRCARPPHRRWDFRSQPGSHRWGRHGQDNSPGRPDRPSIVAQSGPSPYHRHRRADFYQ